MRLMVGLAAVVTMGCAGNTASDGVTDTGGPTDGPTDGPSDVSDGPTDTGTAPPTGCATVTGVTQAQGGLWLQRKLEVTLDQPSEVWATCTAGSDPSEVILVESDGAAASHTLDVVGLYENETWSCRVAPTCDGAVAVDTEPFTTQSLPESAPAFTVTTSPTTPMHGVWTMLNANQSCNLFADMQEVMIVDPQGRIRWIYEVGTEYELDIDASWTGEFVHLGGGWGLFDEGEPHRGTMRQIALNGDVLYERDLPAFGMGYNHHSEPMSDGEVLSLTTSQDTDGSTTWYGVAIERLDPSTDGVTWSWSSQQLFDDGTLPAHSNNDSPYHANALEWTTDAHGDAVWVSLYVGQQVWRIDRASGDRTHVLGPGGDFTLLDYDGTTPLPGNEWTSAQHDPDFAADGRVLLYDNGVDYLKSRVLELQLDLDDRTATKTWEWTEPGWWTPIVGDADYLDNGHVLVTKGVLSCLAFWLTEHSASIELDPATDEEVWRMEFDDRGESTFRSQRYDGCEIFENAKHCSDVADRIAELEGLL